MLWQRPATAEVFRGTSTINSSSRATTSPPPTPLESQNRFSNEASGTVTTPAGSKSYPGGDAFDLLGRVSSLSAVIGDPFTRKTFLHQHHKPVNSLVEGTVDGGRPDVNVAQTAPRPHTANASNSRQIKSLKELKQDMSDEEHARLFYQPQQEQQQSKTSAWHSGEGSVGSLFSSVKPVSVMSGDHRSSSGLQQRPATANATLFFSMQRDQRSDCTTSMMRKQSTSSVHPGDSIRRTQQGGRVSPPTNGTASAGATVVRPASAMLLNTKAKLENLLREEGAALMAARDEQQRKEVVAPDNVAQRVRPLSASDSDSLSSSSTARAAAYQPTPDDRQQIRYLQQQLDAQQQQHEAGAVTDVWDDSAIDPKMFSAAPTPDPQALQPPWHTSTSPSHGSAVEGTSWRSASGGGSVPRPTSAVSGQNPLNSWSRPTSAHDAQQVHRRPPPAPRSTSTASSMNGSGGLPPTSRSVSPSATLSAASYMSQFDKTSVLVPKIYLQQQSQQQQQVRTQQQVSSIDEQPVSPVCSTSPDCLVIEHENNPYHQPLDVAHQLASDGRHTANSDEVTSVMVEATKPAPTLVVQHENDADAVRSRPASAYAAKFRQKLMEVMSEPITPQKRLVQNDDNEAPLQKLDPTSTGIDESSPTDVQRSDTIAPRVVPVSDDIAAFLGEHFFSLKDLQDELRRVEGVLAEGASSAGFADD